jgi:hypothetical protein
VFAAQWISRAIIELTASGAKLFGLFITSAFQFISIFLELRPKVKFCMKLLLLHGRPHVRSTGSSGVSEGIFTQSDGAGASHRPDAPHESVTTFGLTRPGSATLLVERPATVQLLAAELRRSSASVVEEGEFHVTVIRTNDAPHFIRPPNVGR